MGSFALLSDDTPLHQLENAQLGVRRDRASDRALRPAPNLDQNDTETATTRFLQFRILASLCEALS